MAARVIDDFEFVWMLRGQARLLTDERDVPLSPGQLLLVPPGVRHGFAWDHRRPSRHGYVHFRPEEVGRRVAARVRLRRMTEHDPLAGLCAHLLWLGREPTGDREDQARRTLRFLLGVFTSGALPDDEPPATLPDPLSLVVEHLRRAWSRMPLHPVRIDELAAVTHLSRGYLSRLFHREFGIGIAAALESLRCSRAETLLVRTELTIGSIARQCGFADVYHFSHRFAHLYGIPPSTYRDVGGPSLSVLNHPGVRGLAHAVWD